VDLCNPLYPSTTLQDYNLDLLFFTARNCNPLAQTPSWITTPCRRFATAYSMYSQLPSVYEGRLLHSQPEDAPRRGDSDPFNMETATGSFPNFRT
jgi:hypothetical protein